MVLFVNFLLVLITYTLIKTQLRANLDLLHSRERCAKTNNLCDHITVIISSSCSSGALPLRSLPFLIYTPVLYPS